MLRVKPCHALFDLQGFLGVDQNVGSLPLTAVRYFPLIVCVVFLLKTQCLIL